MAEVDEEDRLKKINYNLYKLNMVMKDNEKNSLAKYPSEAVDTYFDRVKKIINIINLNDIYLSDDFILKLAWLPLKKIEIFFQTHFFISTEEENEAENEDKEENEEVFWYAPEELNEMLPQGNSPLTGKPIKPEYPKGTREDYFLGPKGNSRGRQ